MVSRSKRRRIVQDEDEPETWQCSNKTHPIYNDPLDLIGHLIRVHKLALQLPEKSAETIARESLA